MNLPEGLRISAGITDSQKDVLIATTQQDSAIHAFTNDYQGGNGRFASRENYEKWKAEKNAKLYTLINGAEDLKGLIWFNKVPLSLKDRILAKGVDIKEADYTLTIAIRMYGDARGVGLAEPFAREVMMKYKQTRHYLDEPSKKVWLATSEGNKPAEALYTKLGFTKITAKPNKNNKHIMVADLDSI